MTDQLTAYLDGELDPAAASAMRGHLRICEACRIAAEDHAAIRDRLSELARPEPPPAVWEGVLARLGEAEIADARRSPWSRLLERLRPHLVPAGLAATACAAAVLVMHFRGGDSATPTGERAAVVMPPPAPTMGPSTGPSRGDVQPAPAPGPVRDATLALADEAARIDARFRDTTAQLLPLARESLRGGALGRFDRDVAALEAKVVRAPAGAARDRAWHTLITFLERAALGEAGGRVAMNEAR